MSDESMDNPYASPRTQSPSAADTELTFTSAQHEFMGRALWLMRTVVAFLALGILVFAAIIVFMMFPVAANDPFMIYIAVAFDVSALLAAFVAPRVVAARALRAIRDGEPPSWYRHADISPEVGIVAPLTAVFHTRLIISAALLEGAAFMSLTSYMIEGQPILLDIAAALVLLILLQFPTRRRLEAWIGQQLTYLAA